MADVLHRVTKAIEKSVHTPHYSSSAWIINPDLSAVQGVDKKYWKIVGDVISEMDQSEKDAVDAAELDDLKHQRYKQIDIRTGELINQGFEFPPSSGNIFSLSSESQHNIHGVYTSRNLPELSYPINWLTKDDDASVSLTDAATVEGFFLTALGTVRAHKDSGSAIKEQIRAAVDTAAVNAISDDR